MKYAQALLYKHINEKFSGRVAFMATVHGEWQLECEEEISESVGKLGAWCIKEAAKKLNCTVPMDGDYRIGRNWSECH